MESQQVTAGSGAPGAGAPDWASAAPRLASLQRLQIKNLPTGRVVFWTLFGSGLVLAISVAILVIVIDAGSAFATALAVIGIVFCLLGVLLGVERWRTMRTGRLGQGRLERIFDHRISERVDSTADLAIEAVIRGPELVLTGIETFTETLADIGAGLFGGIKRRGLERMAEAIRSDLQPGERALVVLPAMRVPHGPSRVLIYVTFGMAYAFWLKSGILTVTDRRLLFHRYRRKKASLLTADALGDVSVVDWYKGIGATERFQSVLILKRADGSIARFQIPWLYRSEGRKAFELLAAVSKEPPTVLVHFWRQQPSETA